MEFDFKLNIKSTAAGETGTNRLVCQTRMYFQYFVAPCLLVQQAALTAFALRWVGAIAQTALTWQQVLPSVATTLRGNKGFNYKFKFKPYFSALFCY